MNETLTSRQIAFIIFAAIIGQTLYIPKFVAESGGTGGWIILALSVPIVIILTYMYTYLGYVHKNKTLYEYSQLLVGKYVTYIFSAVYIIYFFLFFSANSRLLCENINIFIMPKTPVNAIFILLISVIYLILSKKLRVIGRLCEFYGTIFMIGMFTVLTIISSQGKLINIRPFFGSVDMITYIKGLPNMIIPFLGFEVLAYIGIARENTKKVFKYTALIVVFIGAYFIYMTEACISVIGVDDITHYKLSLFTTLRSIDVPYLDFLKRLDGVTMVLWFMSTTCHLTVFSYGAVIFISKCFKKIRYEIILPVVLVLSFIISKIPQTYNQAEDMLKYTSYLTVLTSLIIPLTLLIITKVKKYDKNIE
ncbi:MAG: GerAB/ArcD/ProY family transporter [Deltaproteobacteria bacterium]